MPSRPPHPPTRAGGRKLTGLDLASRCPDPPKCFWFNYPLASSFDGREAIYG